MKISICNFKSIGSLVDYEVKPLTILSGTNNSENLPLSNFYYCLNKQLSWIPLNIHYT